MTDETHTTMGEFSPHKADFSDIALTLILIGAGSFCAYYDWSHDLPTLQHYLLWSCMGIAVGGLIIIIVGYFKLRAQANRYRKALSDG